MVHPGYRKRTIFLLVALLLVRFWFGQTFELSGQEAYLWQQGHGTNLSLAYWERGPFVPWLIRIGTTFFGDTELGVRWLAAVSCCLSGFILFYLARHWFSARCAFWTIVLFIVIPMFAWKLSFMTEATASIGLMAVTMLAFCRSVEQDRLGWWVLGAVACGLGLLVGLANIWWVVGLLLYFVIAPERRARLCEFRLWGMVALTILFLLPIVIWWWELQVADVAHAHILNAWAPSRGFSLNHGFSFIWKEIFYLSPVFFVVLVGVLWNLGRQLWEDSRYALLFCLAAPGLVWQNIAAFFSESRFELVPALCLPLVLLAGCFLLPLTTDRKYRWLCWGVIALAGLQSLAGLNPFYFGRGDGESWKIRRTQSGENVTGFYADKRQISWRNLADGIQGLQRDLGATLVIADTPETASALSFYLPRNPFVYVESRSGLITQFDFWQHYDEAASPNDSALFVTRSSDKPSTDLFRDFTEVNQVEDPPLPDFDKAWNIWSCQKFTGSPLPEGESQAKPMPDSDSLPK